MKNFIIRVSYCLIGTLLLVVSVGNADAETYISSKIILSDNKSTTPLVTKMQWSEVEPFHIAVDDNQYIYVLDIYNANVLQFRPDGTPNKQILLKEARFPYINRKIDDGYMYYMIQVSADGSLLYISDGTDEFNWNIYGESGVAIKKNKKIFSYFNRTCQDKFTTDNEVLDKNLNGTKTVTKDIHQGEIFDSSYHFYSIKGKLKESGLFLEKFDINRHKIWQKEINGYKKGVRLIGTDGDENIYILTEGPTGIAKLSRNGQVITHISLPNDPAFGKEKYKKGT